MLLKKASWFSVQDMYNYAKDNNIILLSTYESTFWKEYIDNHLKYDKLFNRLYKSYRYFNQEVYETQTVDEVTTDFVDEVYNHLMLNDKKYSELYRIYVLGEDDNKIFDNFSLTETMNRKSSEDLNITYGARIDNQTNDNTFNSGERTDSTDNKISGFNSSTYQDNTLQTFTKGSQSDSQTNTNTYNKGEEKDIHNNSTTDVYTKTRTGKTSDVANEDLINKHIKLWSKYRFYYYIFNEICAELLLV